MQESWPTDARMSKLCSKGQWQPLSHSKYTWDGIILRRKGKLVVGSDKSLQKDLLGYFHQSLRGRYSSNHARHRLANLVY